MKFTDIKLTEEDMEEINAKIAARTDLSAHNKGVLRQMLVREMKEGIWSNRDYVYGQDEGEAPKGAEW
jgi:hypothetical protein